ncbi:MAG: transposase [Bacillota bacterium]|nr:transposase [Bacillota bacterium]
MVKKLRKVFQVPVSDAVTKHKLAEMEHLFKNYHKMVQWFLTVYHKEKLDFSGMPITRAMDVVEKLCYPTKERETKYNCKGAVHFPQSHYYFTAITESIQKWKSFCTWKKKRLRAGKPIKKQFPEIETYAPSLDSTMFNLDLENGWITINSRSIHAGLNIPVSVPNKKRYNELDADRIPCIKLTKNRKGRFVFHLIQSANKEAILPSSKKRSKVSAFAIDLGERHLVAMSSVELTTGDQFFRKVRRSVKFHDTGRAKEAAYIEGHIRRALQRNGKGRHIPNRVWHAKNIRKQEVWNIVHSILNDVSAAMKHGEVYVFIGDLKAPTMRNKGSLSRRLSSYPRGEMKELLADRLEKLGVHVQLVNEYKTSKTCHTSCDSENTFRKRGLFLCKDCNMQYDADANGSWNIMGRGVRRRNIFPKILSKWVECALGAIP